MSATSFSIKSHVLPGQHVREYPEATASGLEDILQLEVKQYIPLDNPIPQHGEVTIIAAHACACPKELYEPLWDEILANAKTHGFRIRAIWIADMANQGTSGILNAGKLGTDHGWDDHTRDLLHMVNHFRMPRPIIGVGHSLGGTQLMNLALVHPRLFQSLILIEPIISKVAPTPLVPGSPSLVLMSTYRRDRWSSREEAARSFRKLYKSWDQRVFDLWMLHGLRDLAPPSQEVTLTTTKLQEVSSYLRPMFGRTLPHLDEDVLGTLPFYRAEMVRAFKNLPHVRPKTLFIFGKQSPYSLPELRREKLSVTGVGAGGSKEKADEVVLEGGHFLPMENVSACAAAIAARLGTASAEWRADDETFRAQWAKQEKVEISREWMETLAPLTEELRKSKKRSQL